MLEIHKARFLVRSTTGGRQSNIASVHRICLCMWNYFVNPFTACFSWIARAPEVRVKSPTHLWPSRLYVPLKTHCINWHILHLQLQNLNTIFKSLSQNTIFLNWQRFETHQSKTVEIFMRKSAGEDEAQHNQRLYSAGSQGKSVPVLLLSDARLKYIKTKTGSVISHGKNSGPALPPG